MVQFQKDAALGGIPFGVLEVGRGDYVILPRTTTHRWIPTGDEPLRTYAIEANSHIAPPKRYLSRYGQFLEHAPYCERDLRGPAEPLLTAALGGAVTGAVAAGVALRRRD